MTSPSERSDNPEKHLPGVADVEKLNENLSGKHKSCWKEIARLEATITRLQIESSKGYYTPAHESDRQRLKAENQVLRAELEDLKKYRPSDLETKDLWLKELAQYRAERDDLKKKLDLTIEVLQWPYPQETTAELQRKLVLRQIQGDKGIESPCQ